MTWVYTALSSVAVAMLTFLLQTVIKENRELKKKSEAKNAAEWSAIKEGMQCVLRDLLIERYQQYKEQKYISTHGLQNWLAMYTAYKALGGNGVIDHMKDEIEELPIK